MEVSGAESFRTQYDYDKNNRLLTETKLEGGEEKETRYYYDPNGNEISQMMTVLTDTSSGNGKQGSGLAVNSPYAVSKEYDLLNRLTTVQNENGISLYSYRLDGLRSSKTIDGQKTSFVWDGQNMVAELSGSTVKGSYLFGIGLVSSRDSGYYIFNAHGDVAGLTNASGTLTKEYRYDAFGAEISPAEDDSNPYRYAGEYFDTETGDIYLRARYYNPSIGRFSAQDSVARVMRQMPNEQEIADPLSLNLYTYCYNSPLIYEDSSGNSPALLGTAGAAALADGLLPFGDMVAAGILVYVGGKWIWAHSAEAVDDIIDGANFIGGKIVSGIEKLGEFASGILDANKKKTVNLPSYKKIKLDIDHIMSGHGPNGNRGGPDKDRFPWYMGAKEIEKAVREAYRYGEKVKTQIDTVLMRGPWGDLLLKCG